MAFRYEKISYFLGKIKIGKSYFNFTLFITFKKELKEFMLKEAKASIKCLYFKKTFLQLTMLIFKKIA